MRKNKEIEKKKLQKHYQRLGVIKEGYYIKIPRALRKDQYEIMKIFGVFFSNLYGEDPEEEMRKQI